MKKYYLKNNSVILFFLLLFTSTLFPFFDGFAQQSEKKEMGSPPIQNFAATDYNAAPEIRSVLKSSRGFIYAASNSGDILEYDGTAWKKIPVPCGYVFSMVEDKNANIHIANGFTNCFGYLRPNSKTGEWQYVPLRIENISDSIQNSIAFSFVTHVNNEIYYSFNSNLVELGRNTIFKYEDGILKKATKIDRKDIGGTWVTQKGFFFFNGRKIFHQSFKKDETDFSYDSLNIEFAQNEGVYKLYDYSPTELLILGARQTGVLIYNLETKTLKPFGNEEAQTLFKSDQLLTAQKTSAGSWLFGSIQNGIIQTDNKGNITQVISEKEGLIGNIVLSLIEDNQKQIWAGLYSGISKINPNVPVTYWGRNKGVLGSSVENIIRFQNTVFAATVTDILFLDKDGNWQPIKNIGNENRVFKKLILEDGKEHLFAGNSTGLHEIIFDKNQSWITKPIFTAPQARVAYIYNLPTEPNKIYVGDLLQQNFGYVYYDKPNQQRPYPIPLLEGKIITITQQQKDNKLVGYDNEREVVRLDIDKNELITFPKTVSSISFIDDKLNLFEYQKDSVYTIKDDNSLVLNQELTTLLKGSVFNEMRIQQVGNGTLWVYEPQQFLVRIYTKTPQGYQRNNPLEEAVGKYFIRHLHEDEANPNIVWVGTSTGILRVDLSQAKLRTEKTEFSTVLRQIKIGNDSLIFDGNFFTSQKLANDSISYQILSEQSEKDIFSIEHRYNSISFKVAGLFFAEENRTQYSYFLEGLDDGQNEKWSDWTSLNVKEYNNLREGNYTFHAKAKNYLGEESTEVTYQFSILPPWHRTTTAYILYVVFGVGIVFGSSRIYTHRLRKQNEQLENLVAERTDELYQKNAELSTQNEEIVQQRDQLDVKNQQIAEQNKNIVSSINYAKRIQTALLPMEKRIKQEIPNHFIFYKPRDIVSGDFYWIEKVEDKVIIAVADCTGHGVPGAFMSMLGSSGLTDAVFQQKLTAPDLILTHLHNYIYSALKQNQSDNRDGMDMCIIVWDKTQNQIQYAGAMNPLYYVQNEEFFTIKADKIPVGGTIAKERIYTPHTINLHVPTTIYLASDGYQDQFGGQEGRKFMTKQFRELLLEISHLPIKEQENRIEQVFERWKGKTHQIDDVLVMGMKIG